MYIYTYIYIYTAIIPHCINVWHAITIEAEIRVSITQDTKYFLLYEYLKKLSVNTIIEDTFFTIRLLKKYLQE